VRYVPPETFEAWKDSAYRIGFLHVEAGPLVRSSYRADRIARKLRANQPFACRASRPSSGAEVTSAPDPS
jgi:hypothetical protein